MDDEVELECSDGRVLQVNSALLCAHSRTIRHLMEECASECTRVPLHQLDHDTLQWIMRIVGELDQGDPKHEYDPRANPLTNAQVRLLGLQVNDGYKYHCTPEQVQKLVQLMMAANFLDMEQLLNVVQRAFAQLLCWRAPEDIPALFGLDGPLDDEDKEIVFQRYPFLRS